MAFSFRVQRSAIVVKDRKHEQAEPTANCEIAAQDSGEHGTCPDCAKRDGSLDTQKWISMKVQGSQPVRNDLYTSDLLGAGTVTRYANGAAVFVTADAQKAVLLCSNLQHAFEKFEMDPVTKFTIACAETEVRISDWEIRLSELCEFWMQVLHCGYRLTHTRGGYVDGDDNYVRESSFEMTVNAPRSLLPKLRWIALGILRVANQEEVWIEHDGEIEKIRKQPEPEFADEEPFWLSRK
jgi:hypothetical protein